MTSGAEPKTTEAILKLEQPRCAYCPTSSRVCRQGPPEQGGPGFCPSRVDEEGLRQGVSKYADPSIARVAKVSAEIEAEGYCRWTRLEETCAFAKRLGFKRLGIAHCIGFIDLAHTLSDILESHGFEVVSVNCKTGGIPKEEIGISDEQKVHPGSHESMCNPVAQAILLDRAGCELNIILGLCVGHDSLFIRTSKALVTTLVAKDRVLAHNPIGALHLSAGYLSRVWGPNRPTKRSKRRKTEGR